MRKPAGARARPGAWSFFLLMIVGAVGLYLGWRSFWFLTDDAFIEFRYVSNSLQGFGYVWNAPPFLPVEGYTSFLWVALLDVVWRIFGVDPTRSANVISLVLSFAQLVLASLLVAKIAWTPTLRRFRLAFLGLFLAGVLWNRTFLAWTSSGLETALFNFLLTLWVFVVLTVSAARARVVLASSTAMLLTLTRPDGLLFVGATCAIVVATALAQRNRRALVLFGLLPLVGVIVYEAWRIGFYGAWLPNTYYAKVVEPWPASGVRYLASFILEYGLWFPTIVVVALALRQWRAQPARTPEEKSFALRAIPWIALATLAFHLAYYTFVVGGDHFEFRVYSYTIPLLFAGFAYALNRFATRARTAVLLMSTFVVVSMPVPWTHWFHSKDLRTRSETHRMLVRVAPWWPKPVAWYAELFDRSQEWLIAHSVCRRHQEHKAFWWYQTENHPTRAEGSKILREGFPVHAARAVGMPAWVFPNVNIIDTFGLNDFIVARTPYPMQERLMAHGRQGPGGYVASYAPNVEADGTVTPRPHPLTATRIACLEQFWRSRLPEIRAGVPKFDEWRYCAE